MTKNTLAKIENPEVYDKITPEPMFGSGGTDMNAALEEAFKSMQFKDKITSVVYFTDEEPTEVLKQDASGVYSSKETSPQERMLAIRNKSSDITDVKIKP